MTHPTAPALAARYAATTDPELLAIAVAGPQGLATAEAWELVLAELAKRGLQPPPRQAGTEPPSQQLPLPVKGSSYYIYFGLRTFILILLGLGVLSLALGLFAWEQAQSRIAPVVTRIIGLIIAYVLVEAWWRRRHRSPRP